MDRNKPRLSYTVPFCVDLTSHSIFSVCESEFLSRNSHASFCHAHWLSRIPQWLYRTAQGVNYIPLLLGQTTDIHTCLSIILKRHNILLKRIKISCVPRLTRYPGKWIWLAATRLRDYRLSPTRHTVYTKSSFMTKLFLYNTFFIDMALKCKNKWQKPEILI